MKIINGIIGGILLGVALSVVVGFTVSPMLSAGDAQTVVKWPTIAWFAGVALGVLFALKAATVAKVWRRVLVALALICFALPLAGIIFSGGVAAMHPEASKSAGAMAGYAVGGTLVTGLLAIVGFFLGAIFLIVGLLIGRDPKIVYAAGAPPAK